MCIRVQGWNLERKWVELRGSKFDASENAGIHGSKQIRSNYWTCRKGEAAVREPAGVSTTRRRPPPPSGSGGEGPRIACISATASCTALSSDTDVSALACRRGRPADVALDVDADGPPPSCCCCCGGCPPTSSLLLRLAGVLSGAALLAARAAAAAAMLWEPKGEARPDSEEFPTSESTPGICISSSTSSVAVGRPAASGLRQR